MVPWAGASSVSTMDNGEQTVSFYKYVKFEDLMRILGGSIRFTQPGAFNDPFEMVPELHVPEKFGNRDIDIGFSLTAPRREPCIGELDVDFESDHCGDWNSRRILASLNQSIGILCMSRNGSSLLMWSHYADSYSGAILEVDESHEFFVGHFAVDYREQRPKKDITSYIAYDNPVPIAELCVKPKEWEYEAEVRVVRELSDCKCVSTDHLGGYPVYVMEFPVDCIKSVILGERMCIHHQRKVWEAVKDTRISLYLDAVSNWGYCLRREPIWIPGMKSPLISPRTANIFADVEGTIGDLARWQLKNHPLGEMMNDTL